MITHLHDEKALAVGRLWLAFVAAAKRKSRVNLDTLASYQDRQRAEREYQAALEAWDGGKWVDL